MSQELIGVLSRLDSRVVGFLGFLVTYYGEFQIYTNVEY